MRHYFLLLAAGLISTAGCGAMLVPEAASETTSSFLNPLDGVYVLADGDDSGGDAALAMFTQGMFSPLTIKGDVVRYGNLIVGEFQLIDPAFQGNTLKADAWWHEDVGDPGDMTEVAVEFRPSGKFLEFTIFEDGEEGATLRYKRKG